MRTYLVILLFIFGLTSCAHGSWENVTLLEIPRYGPFTYPISNSPRGLAISGDGEKIFYFNHPTVDVTKPEEVILVDLNTWNIRQVTEQREIGWSGFGASMVIDTTYEGDKIVFNSPADYTGQNAEPDHTNEIFSLNLSNNQIKQISDLSFLLLKKNHR